MRGRQVNASDNGVFDIVPTKKKINANSIAFGGEHPYVARGEAGNGIRGRINFDEEYLNPGNTISFGQDTATMYYQPQDYFTGDKIQIFKLNEQYEQLTENVALYLISAMNKVFANFSWGNQSFAVDVLADMEIELPVTSQNKIDFTYMEQYIRSMEKFTIKGVVKYKNHFTEATK